MPMNFFRAQRQTISLALTVMVFASSSCTNIQNDGTRTRTEGALAGSVLGGVAGAIIGHQTGNLGRGALIGAAIGGLGGLALGNHVANKKATYRTEEEWLDACIAQARKTNANARAYNAQLSKKITTLRNQASSSDLAVRKKAKAAIVQLQREAKSELSKVDSEIKSQQGAAGQASGSRSASLRSEISSMQTTRSSMDTNIDRLASLGNSVDA
jgi:uncharacterized protein YcfJ